MKTLAEEIGERIKALRTEKGMSQGQLAKLCGWSGASRVANYEYGTRNVGVDDALSLAKALGTTPVMILFGEQSD
ncbi:helix-turn-helix domain-containing protein, partial [Klebsiella pneumoniae]|uniref:helix-turn-helix domain-containing protein n=2 Tax=Klebsiella/Raoultella group TaxID=2890311 RepID=UPI001330B986